MKQILIFILFSNIFCAKAQKTTLESYGIKIEIPFGWTISNTDGVYTCYSSNQSSGVVITKDEENSIEYYIAALRTGVDFGDGITVRTAGKLIFLSTAKSYSEVIIIGSSGTFKGWGGLMQTKNNGVIGFLVVADKQMLDGAKKAMLTMLSSCEEISMNDNAYSSGIHLWYNILTANHLQGNFDTSDDYASSSSFDFCAGGTCTYTRDINSSLLGSRLEKKYGAWQLTTNAGKIILTIRFDNGDVWKYNLKRDGNIVHMNNVRYQITKYRPYCN